MGVSENSVPLNPMVLLIMIPMKNGYFIGNINPTFSVTNPNPTKNSPEIPRFRKMFRDSAGSGFTDRMCQCMERARTYEGMYRSFPSFVSSQFNVEKIEL